MPKSAPADRPVSIEPPTLPACAPPAGLAARGLLLLATEGASVAFFVRTLRGARWLPAFVARNDLAPAVREHLAVWVLCGAAIPVVVAAIALGSAWRRGGRAVLEARVERTVLVARLASFSLLLWAIPSMMSVAAWIDRDLAFLLCAAALVVGFERALRCSLDAAQELGVLPSLRDGLAAAWSRLSARLRAGAPHAGVATLVAGFVGYMSYFTWLQHLRRQTSGFDLGYFATFFWNTLHGRPFYCPITHRSLVSVGRGRARHVSADPPVRSASTAQLQVRRRPGPVRLLGPAQGEPAEPARDRPDHPPGCQRRRDGARHAAPGTARVPLHAQVRASGRGLLALLLRRPRLRSSPADRER